MAASTYINAYPMGAALQKLFIEEFGAINENASQFIDNFLDLSGDHGQRITDAPAHSRQR